MTQPGPAQPQVTQRQVTYQTGEVYVGQWLQVSPTLGYPHGWGRKYGNDEYYEGQWYEGLKHGMGTRTWSSGETYDGTWRENKRQGYGIQTYVDGTKYEGGWNNDVECGWGTKTKPNNEVYTGGFKDGKEFGFGVRDYPDGRKYEGGIKNGQADGYGVGNFKEGRKIEGGGKDGQAHGWGTETVGTLKHVGNFAGGFWDGPGEQTYDKKVTKGEWSKGKLVEKPKADEAKGKPAEADKGKQPANPPKKQANNAKNKAETRRSNSLPSTVTLVSFWALEALGWIIQFVLVVFGWLFESTLGYVLSIAFLVEACKIW